MSHVRVSDLARQLGMDSERLLRQLKRAEVDVDDETSLVSDEDKHRLLALLRQEEGRPEAGGDVAAPTKITLKRKVRSDEIRQSLAGGRSRSVQVEVRKKRTFVRPEDAKHEAKGEEPIDEVVTPAPVPTASVVEAAPVEPTVETKVEATPAAPEVVQGQPEAPVEVAPPVSGPESEVVAPVEKTPVVEPQAVAPKVAEAKKVASVAEKPKEQPKPANKGKDKKDEKKAPVETGAKGAAAPAAPSQAEKAKAKADAEASAPNLGPTLGIFRPKLIKKAAPKPEPAKKAEPESRSRPGKQPTADRPPRPERTAAPAAPGATQPAAPGGAPTDDRSRRKKGRKEKDRFRDEVGGRGLAGRKKVAAPIATQVIAREVKIPEAITVSELAKRMGVKAGDVVKQLFMMGTMVTINQTLDAETAQIVVEEMGHKAVMVLDSLVEEELGLAEDREEDLETRPPVVTVMGHGDHGKTSLLDAIRSADVASREAGGITQHIGAYVVHLEDGRQITFLDTPGHEAFTSMRARGAKVTDVVILVVAADDGVMPQTVEAIHHARAAEVPIVVAVNKMDKPGANPEKVTQQLADNGLVSEEWGGDTMFVQVSAKQRMNIDALLEGVLLQSDVLDLKANPTGPARGVVIEARLDRGRGAVATILVERGTLKPGDFYVMGREYGRVRTMIDEHGKDVLSATPAHPVEVTGLSGVPHAGDEFIVVESERKAREVANFRQGKYKEIQLSKKVHASLEDIFSQVQEGGAVDLSLIVKADVQGSVEALRDAFEKLSTDKVKVKVIHSGVGGIVESDALLAAASNGIIIGFNTRVNPKVQPVIDREGVDVRYYSIIYDAVNEIREAMSGLLAPIKKERIIGYAEVRDLFQVPKMGTIAGSYVTKGVVQRNAGIRVLRDDVVVYEGKLFSLRRFKDDVKEVRESYECGIGIENYNDLRVGDVIECYVVEETAATVADL